MNAEGRIVTAARWISGANGTLGGAAGTTGLGYGKSKWQRATEANRAVEYAIKGVVMALDGRVDQRHNSRELAHHLQRRGEDVGMAQLDDVQPQKGRTPTPYEEFENPEFKDLSDEQTARILRAAATIVGNSERRVQALGREHDIKVELGVPAEGWTPPADVRDELEKRAARNGTIGSQARAGRGTRSGRRRGGQ
jgi:HEPN domain-containing protein